MLERTLKSLRIVGKICYDLYRRLQEGDCLVTEIFRDGRNKIFSDMVYTSRGLFLGVKEYD